MQVRQATWRRAATVALAALLLVPIVLRGHHHSAREASGGPCAACIVVHHAPAASAPAMVAPAPCFHGVTAPLASVTVALRLDRTVRPGRAPPARLA